VQHLFPIKKGHGGHWNGMGIRYGDPMYPPSDRPTHKEKRVITDNMYRLVKER